MANHSAPERRIGFLERTDCRIHYEVTGAGPALLFLHGLGGNHMSWWQQVAHFAPTHTCITLTARGFAPSSPIPGGPDPAEFAGDIAALLDHLGLDSAALVAQSMGGWGAVEFTLAHPGSVGALVLAATTGTLDFNAMGEAERSRLAGWQEASTRAVQACIDRHIHVACGLRMATERPSLHLLYKHIDEMNAALEKNALRARLGCARTRQPSDLAMAGCPILLISGDEDIVIPPFAADAIARVVPGARAVHIADAGHSAYFERAEVFNSLIEQFLRDLI